MTFVLWQLVERYRPRVAGCGTTTVCIMSTFGLPVLLRSRLMLYPGDDRRRRRVARHWRPSRHFPKVFFSRTWFESRSFFFPKFYTNGIIRPFWRLFAAVLPTLFWRLGEIHPSNLEFSEIVFRGWGYFCGYLCFISWAVNMISLHVILCLAASFSRWSAIDAITTTISHNSCRIMWYQYIVLLYLRCRGAAAAQRTQNIYFFTDYFVNISYSTDSTESQAMLCCNYL